MFNLGLIFRDTITKTNASSLFLFRKCFHDNAKYTFKKDMKDQLCWVPFVDQLVGFVGQEGPLMAALFDTTEESRENKPCEAKGQKQATQQPGI